VSQQLQHETLEQAKQRLGNLYLMHPANKVVRKTPFDQEALLKKFKTSTNTTPVKRVRPFNASRVDLRSRLGDGITSTL
jgi:hypothetical protein